VTLAEVVAEAQAAGYTHVRTMAGPVALGAWMPYGGRLSVIEFYRDGGRIRERVAPQVGKLAGREFVTGVWVLE
jgi:hypothetical protein